MDIVPTPLREALLERIGQVADGIDHLLNVPASPPAPNPSPGLPATMWAVTKAAFGAAGLPVSVPTLAIAAQRSQREALRRIDAFGEHLEALCSDGPSPLPGARARRAPASGRYVITSDLHRCIPGRLDWPARQQTKDLYRRVLEEYAADEWSLIENGDVEDFWMVGGSTWGAVYDVARLASGAAGFLADDTRRALLGDHLDRIVDNNAALYHLLDDGFARSGRYLRTIGNHDDVFTDPALVARLGQHLHAVDVPDAIVLERDGATADDGVSGVDAVVMHGHLTDAWNGPGLATLGRVVTWAATGLDDLPRPASTAGLPEEPSPTALLGGRGENRLITVDPRYGGNRRFDSLDEERLFASLAAASHDHEWPWLIFGHTHFPMLRPVDASGTPVRYANSGCGVLTAGFTALEWDPTADEPIRLVLHHADGRDLVRTELVPDGDTLRVR